MLACRNFARPLKEEGDADPAFVHLSFFSPQGKVAAGGSLVGPPLS